MSQTSGTHSLGNSLLDDIVKPNKRSTENEQNIRRIYMVRLGPRYIPLHVSNHLVRYHAENVPATCGALWPVLDSPGGGISACTAPLAWTVTIEPSIIRSSACCTPSPPTSREPSEPELVRRAILSTSSMYTMPMLSERRRVDKRTWMSGEGEMTVPSANGIVICSLQLDQILAGE